MAAGMFYWMVPRLYGTKLHSRGAANLHFYMGTIGILMYVVAMWVSGITQGLMWRAETEDGGLLYPNFVETVQAILPMYWFRMVGGTLYLVGMIIMAWNLFMTVKGKKPVDGEADVVEQPEEEKVDWKAIVFGKPVILAVVVCSMIGLVAVANGLASTLLVSVALVIAVLGTMAIQLSSRGEKVNWHRLLEGRSLIFTVFVVIAVLIGGIAELVPTLVIGNEAARTSPMRPYTALELHGRDVYISEGCYTCHSQMIRPFTWEAARYPGGVSTMNDTVWDHPFQWGSKRTGPDLARESSQNRGPVWHYNHMLDPRSTTPGSIMPFYPHMRTTAVDFDTTEAELSVMQTLGVPYDDAQVSGGAADAQAQALSIATALRAEVELGGAYEGTSVPLEESQLVALIAYLERLGRNESGWQGVPAGGSGAQVSRAAQAGASE
jgi:cytochrome c oxidase cbb3-type subunit I/II